MLVEDAQHLGGNVTLEERDGIKSYFEIELLLDLLAEYDADGGLGGKYSDVRLLSASWLIAAAGENRALPRRQELEASDGDAPYLPEDRIRFILKEEVEKVSMTFPQKPFYPGVLVLSYCWHSKESSDPDGSLLRMIAPMLAWYMHQRQKARPAKERNFGVFIDYWSTFQGQRTKSQQVQSFCSRWIAAVSLSTPSTGLSSGMQRVHARCTSEVSLSTLSAQAAFERALTHMDVWYAHAGTAVLRLTKMPSSWQTDRKYSDRGWVMLRLMHHRTHMLRRLHTTAHIFKTRCLCWSVPSLRRGLRC